MKLTQRFFIHAIVYVEIFHKINDTNILYGYYKIHTLFHILLVYYMKMHLKYWALLNNLQEYQFRNEVRNFRG